MNAHLLTDAELIDMAELSDAEFDELESQLALKAASLEPVINF